MDIFMRILESGVFEKDSTVWQRNTFYCSQFQEMKDYYTSLTS